MDIQTPQRNYLNLWLFCFLSLIISNANLILSNGQLIPIVDSEGSDGVNQLRTYIVYVEEHEHHELLNDKLLESYHLSFLPNTTLDSGEPRLLWSYRYVISGFAARLTQEEADAMGRKEGFLLAYPEEVHRLRTTHTPEFLGLSGSAGFWFKNNNHGEGMVIGVIDSGIPPNHPSFSGDGVPPPPAKWAGKCKFEKEGYCNNKVVQAVTISGKAQQPTLPPLDKTGHGSGVASIAAGNFVKNANAGGKAAGTASGMAPRSHLAIYNVCGKGCPTADILAAGDEAIKDGVDVIVISSGASNQTFIQDVHAQIGIAAFRKNIMVCSSAGNDGTTHPIDHSAPWTLTIGSSTTDRILGSSKKNLAPKVAQHSTRGPSLVNGNILKPDVLAPGYEILLARNAAVGSPAKFRLASGTSYAAPHVAGVVALIKKEHPTWNPARIISAIVTTADHLDQSGNPMREQFTNKVADIFATGAGQVNATKALNPGLVYDAELKDYFGYLCGLKYTDAQIKVIAHGEKNLKCAVDMAIESYNLNHPSISASMKISGGQVVSFKRTVTNIGLAHSAYTAQITEPEGVSVQVVPKTLRFTALNEKKSFEVELVLRGPPAKGKKSTGGRLGWVSGEYEVKSPIAVAFQK